MIVAKPAGSSPSLSDSALASPTFVADQPGAYLLELIVHDGAEDSNPGQVPIIVSAADILPPGTGTVKGKVTDANTGRNLADVLVKTDTGESGTTSKSGRYTIIDVPEGTGTLTASKTGYKTDSFSVDVAADETTNFFFALAQE